MKLTTQPEKSKDIKLKLLLTGGHEYTIFVKSDSPLLQLLIKTLLARSQKNTHGSHLLQIPIEEGHSVLCFPSQELVGIITEPPIYLENLESISTPTIQTSTPVLSPEQENTGGSLISRYALINNFLTASENQQLFDYVCQKQGDFVATTTSTNADNYRISKVLHSFPEFREIIVEKVKKVMPDVTSKLNIPSFPLGEIESQLTLHNDGNFYKVHNDNGSPDTATRTLTYVYYFHREPKPFTGGELIIYDSKVEGKYFVKADTFKTIEPRNNSVVFFLSRYMHEVLPVSCRSQDFSDSRFTINGWVRRAD